MRPFDGTVVLIDGAYEQFGARIHLPWDAHQGRSADLEDRRRCMTVALAHGGHSVGSRRERLEANQALFVRLGGLFWNSRAAACWSDVDQATGTGTSGNTQGALNGDRSEHRHQHVRDALIHVERHSLHGNADPSLCRRAQLVRSGPQPLDLEAPLLIGLCLLDGSMVAARVDCGSRNGLARLLRNHLPGDRRSRG